MSLITIPDTEINLLSPTILSISQEVSVIIITTTQEKLYFNGEALIFHASNEQIASQLLEKIPTVKSLIDNFL